MVSIILLLSLGTSGKVPFGANETLCSEKHIYFIVFFPAENQDWDPKSP